MTMFKQPILTDFERLSLRLTFALLFVLTLRLNPGLGQEHLVEDRTSAQAFSAESLDHFETHIRPVLVEHCYQCHSADAKIVQGGLRLDTAEAMLKGGDSGELFVPGDSEDSLLMAVLNWEQYEMPPSGKLPDTTIQHFKNWIEMGAPDPRLESTTDLENQPLDPASHWAFQPVQKTEPPPFLKNQLNDSDTWPVTEIDRFVLSSLQQANLKPNPLAEPRVLLRRLHFVLTGLSPTYEQYAAFETLSKQTIFEAYRQTVEQLMNTPEFGQRWGRHWLDVARYADTKGYVFQEDRNYYQAYRYRDWVIDSFNSDLPYDQFVIAQLAADQLGDPTAKPAMGFLTLGRRFINNQQDIIDDRIDVTARGLMGLTVACARCHDHKYDPISIDEYYSLYGVFASSYEPKPEIKDDENKEMDTGQDRSASQEGESTATVSADDWLTLRDSDQPSQPVVFIRGNPHNPGHEVARQFLQILSSDQPQPFLRGSGRQELAEAIASPDNPLTARVWVNRVWMHLMGEGLVATPSDFGTRGDLPSHPELLDWLTYRFIQQGWSTKWLIKEIILSRTFAQSSQGNPVAIQTDPENRLLWRMNRRRLDWETLRDNLLLAAGDLDLSLGGAAVELNSPPFTRRRTVYGFIDRQNLPGPFRTFDFANPDTHVPKRPYTVVPQQALFLMNSPFAMEQAIHLESQIEKGKPMSDQEKIGAMFRQVHGRQPEPAELELALEFIKTHMAGLEAESQKISSPETLIWNSVDDFGGPQGEPLTRWQQLAHILLMTNEFMFID